MSGSNKQLDKNSLLERHEEIAFEIALLLLAEEEGEKLVEENSKLVQEELFSPTEADNARFKKNLNKNLKQLNSHLDIQTDTPTRLYKRRRIGALIAAVILIFSFTLMSVTAVREAIVNFFIGIYDEYAEFGIDDNSLEDTISWGTGYVPTYIPRYFKATEINVSDAYKKVLFTNLKNEKETILYLEMEGETLIKVDVENADLVETLSINNLETIFVKKNGLYTISCIDKDNKRSFSVQSTIPKEEIVKIAENVKLK